jgi:hypothetical protein
MEINSGSFLRKKKLKEKLLLFRILMEIESQAIYWFTKLYNNHILA